LADIVSDYVILSEKYSGRVSDYISLFVNVFPPSTAGQQPAVRPVAAFQDGCTRCPVPLPATAKDLVFLFYKKDKYPHFSRIKFAYADFTPYLCKKNADIKNTI
jgi:hypothetical protein